MSRHLSVRHFVDIGLSSATYVLQRLVVQQQFLWFLVAVRHRYRVQWVHFGLPSGSLVRQRFGVAIEMIPVISCKVLQYTAGSRGAHLKHMRMQKENSLQKKIIGEQCKQEKKRPKT